MGDITYNKGLYNKATSIIKTQQENAAKIAFINAISNAAGGVVKGVFGSNSPNLFQAYRDRQARLGREEVGQKFGIPSAVADDMESKDIGELAAKNTLYEQARARREQVNKGILTSLGSDAPTGNVADWTDDDIRMFTSLRKISKDDKESAEMARGLGLPESMSKDDLSKIYAQNWAYAHPSQLDQLRIQTEKTRQSMYEKSARKLDEPGYGDNSVLAQRMRLAKGDPETFSSAAEGLNKDRLDRGLPPLNEGMLKAVKGGLVDVGDLNKGTQKEYENFVKERRAKEAATAMEALRSKQMEISALEAQIKANDSDVGARTKLLAAQHDMQKLHVDMLGKMLTFAQTQATAATESGMPELATPWQNSGKSVVDLMAEYMASIENGGGGGEFDAPNKVVIPDNLKSGGGTKISLQPSDIEFYNSPEVSDEERAKMKQIWQESGIDVSGLK